MAEMQFIAKIAALGIFATIVIILIKQQRPELALQISVLLSAIVFLIILPKIASVFSLFKELANRADVNFIFLGTVLRIVGIAYIAEFGAQICRDAGESAVATKIEFAAKVLVLVLAVPIIIGIVEALIKLMP